MQSGFLCRWYGPKSLFTPQCCYWIAPGSSPHRAGGQRCQLYLKIGAPQCDPTPVSEKQDLTQLDDWSHLLMHRGLDVSIKGVLSDLPLNRELSHRFQSKRPSAAKMVPMVLALIDQNVLANF